jgi:hypothetical protein
MYVTGCVIANALQAPMTHKSYSAKRIFRAKQSALQSTASENQECILAMGKLPQTPTNLHLTVRI